MQQIALYLDKFQGLLPPNYIVRVAVCEVLEELKLSTPISAVSVRSGRVYISADGYVKAEIFQNQKTILTKLSQRLSTYKVGRVG